MKAIDTLVPIVEDMKASDIAVIDVSKQTSLTDYMLICNGRSSKHVQSIAEDAMEKMKAAGIPAFSASGFENANWVLVDFGDVILHVMQAETRDFYNLEALWQAK